MYFRISLNLFVSLYLCVSVSVCLMYLSLSLSLSLSFSVLLSSNLSFLHHRLFGHFHFSFPYLLIHSAVRTSFGKLLSSSKFLRALLILRHRMILPYCMTFPILSERIMRFFVKRSQELNLIVENDFLFLHLSFYPSTSVALSTSVYSSACPFVCLYGGLFLSLCLCLPACLFIFLPHSFPGLLSHFKKLIKTQGFLVRYQIRLRFFSDP